MKLLVPSGVITPAAEVEPDSFTAFVRGQLQAGLVAATLVASRVAFGVSPAADGLWRFSVTPENAEGLMAAIALEVEQDAPAPE